MAEKTTDRYYCCQCELWAVSENNLPPNAIVVEAPPRAADASGNDACASGDRSAQQSLSQPSRGTSVVAPPQISPVSSPAAAAAAAAAAASTSHQQQGRKYAQVDTKFLEDAAADEAAAQAQQQRSAATYQDMYRAAREAYEASILKLAEKEFQAASDDDNENVTRRDRAADSDDDGEDDGDEEVSDRFASIQAKFIQGVIEQQRKKAQTNGDPAMVASPEEIAQRLREAQERERAAAEEFLARERQAVSASAAAPQSSINSTQNYHVSDENDEEYDMSKFFDTQYLRPDGRVVRPEELPEQQRRRQEEFISRQRDEQRRMDRMAEAVRGGAALLETHCPYCNLPEVRLPGTKEAVCVPCKEYGPPGAPSSQPAAQVQTRTSATTSTTSAQSTRSRDARIPETHRRGRSESEDEEEEGGENVVRAKARAEIDSLRKGLRQLLEADRNLLGDAADDLDYEYDNHHEPAQSDNEDANSEHSLSMSETRRILESDELKQKIAEREAKRSKLTSLLNTHTMLAEYCPDCLVPIVKPRSETVTELIRDAWRKESPEEKENYIDFADYEESVRDKFANECFCPACEARWSLFDTPSGVVLEPIAPGKEVEHQVQSSVSSSSSASSNKPESDKRESTHSQESGAPSQSQKYVSLDELRSKQAVQQPVHESESKRPMGTALAEVLRSSGTAATSALSYHASGSAEVSAPSSEAALSRPTAVAVASPAVDPRTQAEAQRLTREAKQSVRASIDALRASLDCVTRRLTLVLQQQNAATNDALLSSSAAAGAQGIDQIQELAKASYDLIDYLTKSVALEKQL